MSQPTTSFVLFYGPTNGALGQAGATCPTLAVARREAKRMARAYPGDVSRIVRDSTLVEAWRVPASWEGRSGMDLPKRLS